MNEMQLVVVRNPFDRTSRDERLIPLLDGHTISHIIRDCLPVSTALVVSIDGEIVPASDWGIRALKTGEQMIVMPVVHDNGSDISRALLMIAVVYYAPYLSNWMGGSGFVAAGAGTFSTGLTGTILSFGLMYAGSRVINALLPPPRPNATGSPAASQTYAWNPATTQQPGGVVNRAYGRNKLFGNIIAGYIEQSGDTGQEQTAHLLIDLGTGPYSKLSDFKINDQPIGYYKGVTVTTRYGMLDQDIIPAFNDTKRTRSISAKIVSGKGATVNRTTAADDYDALEIVLICPNGLWHANDQGGMDSVSVHVSVEISADGGATWAHVATEPRTTVAVAPGYWSLGQWVFGRDGGLTAWREKEKGGSDPAAHTAGESGGGFSWSPNYWRWIDVPTEVVVTVNDSITLSGSSTQPIRRTLRVDELARGTQYQVRCTNLTDDNTGSRYSVGVYLGELNEVLYDDFQYPRTVLVALTALATNQLSGSVNFSCMADCAIVRVWDGSAWLSQYSNNPAWVCWDILTQPVLDNDLNVVRYDGLDPSRLILSSFVAWASFCDVLVPDGMGGAEKRCTFDGVFDTSTTLWEAALDVCSTARAMLVFRGTSIVVVVDSARAAPAQLFTVGNTAVSSFTETFLPMRDRAANIEIGYVNAANGFVRDTLTVCNTSITESAAARTQINLHGVTRQSQAWREASWRLKRNELLRRSASISVDIDALACVVGDMIWVQSDVVRWGVGGRAAAGSTTTMLMLDQAITLDTGKTYELKLRLSDDTLLSRVITTAAGTVSAVDVSVAFPSAPVQYDVWAIGETDKAVKEFLVLDVTRDGDQRVKLSLIEYNESLCGLDSGTPALPTPDVSGTIGYKAIAVPECRNLTTSEVTETTADGGLLIHLDLTFDLLNSVSAKVFEGGQLIGEASSGALRRQSVSPGAVYDFQIRPVGGSGESPNATWVDISHTVSDVNAVGVSPVVNGTSKGGMKYRVTETDASYLVEVTTISDPNIIGYEIRVGADFASGALVEINATGAFTIPTADAYGNSYFIRARYLGGGYSSAEAQITVNDAAMPKAPSNVRWRVSEPDLVWAWDASPDAVSYLIYWEDGGVARKIEQDGTSVSVPIPRWAGALLRVYAINAIGFRSKAVDEELTINGRYVYNEVVNVAVPLNTGTYVNLCHVSANVLMKPSILGIAPSLPIADVNDSDLFTLGYNWPTGAGAVSSFASTPVANFRNGFWKDEAGYFESAVIDLGAIYTGILMLNLTKSITDYGAQGVGVYGKALVEYLNDQPIRSLVDGKAFMSARFFVATDSAYSANWKEARNGETVAARYCKVIIEALHVSPLTACTVTGGTLYIDVPDIAESGKAAGVTTSNTIINLVKPFKVITTAMATARGTAKAEVVGTSIGTPCTLTVKTNSATPTDVDWFVKGY